MDSSRPEALTHFAFLAEAPDARRWMNWWDPWHHQQVSHSPLDSEAFTDGQREWLLYSEALWREAHAIAAANPGVDPGDVYHALRSLELPPAERLRRGLTRVRTRPHAS